VGVTTAGYFLGQIDIVKNNIEIAIVAIVALSVLPMAIEFGRHHRQKKAAAAAGRTAVEDELTPG
jgi:membrane-associated protein